MITMEHFIEAYWNIKYRRALLVPEHIKRFMDLRSEYSAICDLFLEDGHNLQLVDEGYSWREWAGQIRRSLKKRVPIGFLAHPILVKTMVFSRRGGIKMAEELIEQVIDVFGENNAKTLLREDYIGNPAIQNVLYMTSANRAWHVSHLGHYKRECSKNIWDCDSLVEWGGGYGSLARVIRKMNPTITYIIIDIPELLALQYIYLASIEGKDNIHLATPKNGFKILSGKVNLISSSMVLSKNLPIRCETFISTWAITESPLICQKHVIQNEFFCANSVLLGFNVDVNNHIVKASFKKSFRKVEVPLPHRFERGNEYWFC